MQAKVGDRLLVRGNRVGAPIRGCEVLEVRHDNGEPPYVVLWGDTGQRGLFFPGPDTYVFNG